MLRAKNKESKIVVITAAVKIAIYGLFLLGYSVCLAAQMLLEGDFSNSNKFKDPAA